MKRSAARVHPRRMTAPGSAGCWRTLFVRRPALTKEDREAVIASLMDASAVDADYLALTLGSCAIATFGLLENSPAVIIGAMIIAPQIPVIQACAYGAVEGVASVFLRAAFTLTLGACVAIGTAAVLAGSVHLTGFGTEILSRTRPNLLDLGIALAAGAIGCFARLRQSLASALAGTAIAVALMPPLCVVGIGLAARSWDVSRGALLLFVTNLLGITLASMTVFLLAGFAHRRGRVAVLWTAALTALVVFPLALSLRELVRQADVESALRTALTTQTATFRNATLVSSRFDWLSQPPTVLLLVRSDEMLSPHQVQQLEAFARRATGQSFHFEVDVTQVQRVTSTGSDPNTPGQRAKPQTPSPIPSLNLRNPGERGEAPNTQPHPPP